MKVRRTEKVHNYPIWFFWILVVNILVVDVIIFHQFFSEGTVLGTSSNDACPSACITRINQALGKTSGNPSKEYYVPFGSGVTTADEWTDIAGASAYIDTSSYGKMKQTIFETTISVPNGSQQVWVRLYNATDKHPVWFSEVTTDNSGPILLASKSITLDSGNKFYQVQMRTQLKAVTNLLQSRVRIITY